MVSCHVCGSGGFDRDEDEKRNYAGVDYQCAKKPAVMERLKAWSYYYLGWPRPPVQDRRLHWVSEQAFARVIQQGQPVLVALLMPGYDTARRRIDTGAWLTRLRLQPWAQFCRCRCAFCETFEKVLKQASDQFAPAGVTVLQVSLHPRSHYWFAPSANFLPRLASVARRRYR